MPQRRMRTTRVVSTERISTSMVRVVLGGDELDGFAPEHADSYVKLVFPDPAAGPDDRPRTRTYTVRSFDAAARELALDVVVHGDAGLAGPWAAAAQPGDEIALLGPGGGYNPDPDADHHVLVGDESALPAIAAALERIPSGRPVHVFLEVHGPEDRIELTAPDGADVTWLHRGTGAVGSRLVDEVRAWSAPEGTGHWFVHGEAGVVRDLRRHLRADRGLPMSALSISGYWRLGVDDEGWRAVKRDWNAAVEESEQVLA